ncbi:unnamed protein product [Cuscuta campestris]|uniref:Uncharacterized protein n=1 Tax=Cuscuta campestris TaxID=132261 RepID=A0A484LSR1_9ASTE|nr:unnamed protein product [Cuscuta campestris]
MRELRPSNDVASVHSSSDNLNPNNNTIWQWKSPIPYVFVSLSVAFAVILLAIVVLVCSLHKHHHQQQQQPSGDGGDKSGRSAPDKAAAPSFIVVMAGDAKPTHIAIPIPSSLSPHLTDEEQVFN